VRENEGFDILVNGAVPTFRDQRETAYQAARYLKSRHPKDFVEVLDCATGTKLIVFEDGRIAVVPAGVARISRNKKRPRRAAVISSDCFYATRPAPAFCATTQASHRLRRSGRGGQRRR